MFSLLTKKKFIIISSLLNILLVPLSFGKRLVLKKQKFTVDLVAEKTPVTMKEQEITDIAEMVQSITGNKDAKMGITGYGQGSDTTQW